MFIHPLNHQMSAEHLQMCTVLYKGHGAGDGGISSYGAVPASKGLGKHQSTIKRPATVTHNVNESQTWCTDTRGGNISYNSVYIKLKSRQTHL